MKAQTLMPFKVVQLNKQVRYGQYP